MNADASPASTGLLGWWRDGTPEGRRALVAAGLGWMLDAFDVMLWALVLTDLMRHFAMSPPAAGPERPPKPKMSPKGELPPPNIAERMSSIPPEAACEAKPFERRPSWPYWS